MIRAQTLAPWADHCAGGIVTLPIVDDNGQVWWDGVRLPVVKVESFWTRPDRADLNRWGFMAILASENGAEVSLCFDPDGADR